MDGEDLLNLAVKVAKQFDQEAILYGDERGTYALDVASGESFHIGNTISQNDLGDYYSQVKKRYWKFAFRESEEYAPFIIDGEILPRNHAEGQVMENLGLYVGCFSLDGRAISSNDRGNLPFR